MHNFKLILNSKKIPIFSQQNSNVQLPTCTTNCFKIRLIMAKNDYEFIFWKRALIVCARVWPLTQRRHSRLRTVAVVLAKTNVIRRNYVNYLTPNHARLVRARSPTLLISNEARKMDAETVKLQHRFDNQGYLIGMQERRCTETRHRVICKFRKELLV